MPYSTQGRNNMLDNIGITHVALHNGIPDDDGSNEITGGSPAYARKVVTFNAAAAGMKEKNATDPVFDVPSGETIFYVGFWDALTNGTFLGYAPINGGAVDGVGVVEETSTDTILSPAHGLSDNDRVTTLGPVGESTPSGLDELTIYHVVNSTVDTFQVSLTQGGGAVDILTTGEVYFQKVVPETFGAQGQLTLDTLTLKAED